MSVFGSASARIAASTVIVLLHAAVQAALLAAAPRAPLDAGAIVLAFASGLAMLLAAGALWSLALQGRSRRSLMTLAVAAVLIAACVVVAPVAIPFVIAVMSPVIAAGTPGAAWTSARRRPWRTVGGLVITALAVALAIVVAMLLGLLFPGWSGAAAAWVVIGAGATALTLMWAKWVVRIRRAGLVAAESAESLEPLESGQP